MRTQVTVYLAPDRKAWLKRYAQKSQSSFTGSVPVVIFQSC